MFSQHVLIQTFRQTIRQPHTILNNLNKIYPSLSTSNRIHQNSNEPQNISYRTVNKDRSVPVPVETSIKYLKSQSYIQTYGDKPVWVQYRRNHKGALPPRKTRRTCIRQNVISTGNPCPICRDEYLVLSENNIELLKQFISPHTGAILSYSVTGLCQKKHQELMICVQRAKDRGHITFDIPFRKYNYEEYKPKN